MALDKIKIADIVVDDDNNPRKAAEDSQAFKDLVASIKEHGILQPVGIYRKSGRNTLVWGFRRVAAAKKLGLDVVPYVLTKGSQKDREVTALIENLHRSDLSPWDEAQAIKRLMEEHALSKPEVKQKLGKSGPWVDQRIRLLKMDPEIQEKVKAGELSISAVRDLVPLSKDEQKEAVAEAEKDAKDRGEEKPKHKDVKRQVRRQRKKKDGKQTDVNAVAEAQEKSKKDTIKEYCDEVYRGGDVPQDFQDALSGFFDHLVAKKMIRFL